MRKFWEGCRIGCVFAGRAAPIEIFGRTRSAFSKEYPQLRQQCQCRPEQSLHTTDQNRGCPISVGAWDRCERFARRHLYLAPFMMAASSHDLDMVKFLLAHGAVPDMPNQQGYTDIMAAANTCSYAPATTSRSELAALEGRQMTQLAVVELLAGTGARAAFSPKLKLLSDCCARQPTRRPRKRSAAYSERMRFSRPP